MRIEKFHHSWQCLGKNLTHFSARQLCIGQSKFTRFRRDNCFALTFPPMMLCVFGQDDPSSPTYLNNPDFVLLFIDEMLMMELVTDSFFPERSRYVPFA